MIVIYTVYLITNILNGKFYIGCTKDTSNRWTGEGIGYQGNPDFFSDIRRDGWVNFKKEAIFRTCNIEDAAFIEHFLIRTAKRLCRYQCYNLNLATLYENIPVDSYDESRVFRILSEEEPFSPLRRFYSELTQETPEEYDLGDITDYWE